MPNTHTVTVTPPTDTTNGSCSPNTVRPVGHNALIRFEFATPNSGWTFDLATPFQIKTNQPQPPLDMFSVKASTGNQVDVQDTNGDGKKYAYGLMVLNGTRRVFIDPDIQNDS
jgi:hypothetical protein